MFNLDFSVHALLGDPHRPALKKMSKLKMLWKQRHLTLHLGCS